MTEIFDEAAHWFAVQRRGLMTLDELSAYRTWLRDPRNQAALKRLDAIWISLDEVPLPVARPGRRPGLIVRSAMIAASLLILVGGAGSMSHFGSAASWTELDWWSR